MVRALRRRISDLFNKNNLSLEDTLPCLQPLLSIVNLNVLTLFRLRFLVVTHLLTLP